MARKKKDSADPFPLISWDDVPEDNAVAVEEPVVETAPFEEVEPGAAPVAKVQTPKPAAPPVPPPAPSTKKTKKGKQAKAASSPALPKVSRGLDVRFWIKAALALGGAAVAAGLVAGLVWWKRPQPAAEAPEKPLEAALVGAIESLEQSLEKPADVAPARPGGLAYGYAAGDVLAYNFEFVQTLTLGVSGAFVEEAERRGGRVTASQGGDTKLGYKLGGRADLAVYESGGRMSVGWRFSGMSVEARGAGAGADPRKLEGLQAELNREVLVDMTPLGRIEAVHFPRGTSAWAQGLLSAVVLMARVSFPEKPAATWTAVEEDATGRYTAEYGADAGYRSADGGVTRITRTKTAYDRIACAAGGEATEMPADACRTTITGGLVALLDPEAGRFRTIRVDEQIRVEGVRFAQDLRSNVAGGLRLTGASRDEALAAQGKALAEALRKAGTPVRPGSADIAAQLAADAEAARLRGLTGGLSLDEVVARLEKLAAADALDTPEAGDLFDKLAAILRLDPAAVDVALEIIRTTTAHLAVRAALVDALGAAETPRAQEALLAVVRDTSIEADLRQNAVTGLAMADKPVEGVESLIRTLAFAGASEPASEPALLGMGLLYRKSAAADPARLPALADDLRNAGRVSSDPGWQSLYLESLGNAGLAETLPEVEKFLARDDTRTRARAAFALRFVPGDTAESRLLALARGDASPAVRAAAVQALAFRDSAAAKSAIEAAKQDENAQVRAAAEKAGLK